MIKNTLASPNVNQQNTRSFHLLGAALISVIALATTAHAVPSFARETGMSCIVCHTEFPILTDFGRQFKLSGYTLGANQTVLPPLSVMLQPSFTHTDKDQAASPASGFKRNDNFAVDQVSVFYSGRLFGPYAETLFGPTAAPFLNKFGTFIQTTYSGVDKAWSWDNAEIRYADTATLGGQSLTYGAYVNNNPTMQDPWNTAPAWGFPFSSSALAPTPDGATLIDGGVGQTVLGLGVYAMIANHFYVDLGGYGTLSSSFQKNMGVDPSGETQLADIAPYWRLAYSNTFGNNSWEVGTFGMAANTYPGRDSSMGKDHLVDWGLDSQFQTSIGNNDITALMSVFYEPQQWDASKKLGLTSNSSDHLMTMRATVDYLYDKTYGGAIGYFISDGSNDALLYSGSAKGSPLSDGLVVQLNYLPLNKSGGPSFWPKSNVKLSLQYVMYNRFNGTSAGASDNNTLYLQSWIAF